MQGGERECNRSQRCAQLGRYHDIRHQSSRTGLLIYASHACVLKNFQEFHKKCRASQELIVAQIPWASAGAERSRIAAMNRRAAKDSGSDGGPQGKLMKRNREGRTQQAEGGGTFDQTKEEMLLGDLLAANQEIVEVFAIYEQFETMVKADQEARDAVKRSVEHHDRAVCRFT